MPNVITDVIYIRTKYDKYCFELTLLILLNLGRSLRIPWSLIVTEQAGKSLYVIQELQVNMNSLA